MDFENFYDVPEEALDDLYLACSACGKKIQGDSSDVAFIFDDVDPSGGFKYRETKYVYWFLTNPHLLGFATCNTEVCCEKRADELNAFFGFRLAKHAAELKVAAELEGERKNEAFYEAKYKSKVQELITKNFLLYVADRGNAEMCERILVEGFMEREGAKVVEPSAGIPPVLNAVTVDGLKVILKLCATDKETKKRVYKPTLRGGLGADLVIFTSKCVNGDTTIMEFVQIKLGKSTVQGGSTGERSAGVIAQQMGKVVGAYTADTLKDPNHKIEIKKVLWTCVINGPAKTQLGKEGFDIPDFVPWPERIRPYLEEVTWIKMLPQAK